MAASAKLASDDRRRIVRKGNRREPVVDPLEELVRTVGDASDAPRPRTKPTNARRNPRRRC
jgi:hypothetical protein